MPDQRPTERLREAVTPLLACGISLHPGRAIDAILAVDRECDALDALIAKLREQKGDDHA